MTRVKHQMLLFIWLWMMIVQGCTSGNITFQGKVVDAETLKPIEGAVVVAVWEKSRARFIDSISKFGDAKETMTDKNGEWSIKGPKGEVDNVNEAVWLASAVLGYYFLHDPEFIIYKPGYESVSSLSPAGFIAYPYLAKEVDLEGIVLVRPGRTKEERSRFHDKFRRGLPFMPVKDPEAKLRSSSFSFNYSEDVREIGTEYGLEKGIRRYWVYTITGLFKTATKDERRRAIPRTPSGSERKTPLLNGIVEEEKQFIFGSGSRGGTK